MSSAICAAAAAKERDNDDGVANSNAAALETIGLTICVTAVCVYIADTSFCKLNSNPTQKKTDFYF